MHRIAFYLLVGGSVLTSGLASAETLNVLAASIEPYAIETGSRPGVAVEVLTDIAKRAGMEVDIKYEPWARAQTDTRSGKGLAILPLTRTPDREAEYSWVVPLLSDPVYLQAISKDVNISTLGAARNSTVCVLRGSAQIDILKQAGLPKIEEVTDENTCAKMLQSGHVDAWYSRGMVASLAYAKNGGDTKALLHGAETETPPMYLGGSPDFSKETAARLNKALEAMKADGSYDRILASYK